MDFRAVKKRSELKDAEKILLCLLHSTALLLIIAIVGERLPSGYYTLLRLACCISFAWLAVIVKSPYGKFALAAGAVLYNPILPIHLDDKDLWGMINFITLPVLPSALLFHRFRKPSAKSDK